MENNFEKHNTAGTAQSSEDVEAGVVSAVNNAVAVAVAETLAAAGRPKMMKDSSVVAETDNIQDLVSQAVVAAVRQAVTNAVARNCVILF